MVDSGGYSIANLLQSHTLAVLFLYLFALGGLILLGVSFRGSVVI